MLRLEGAYCQYLSVNHLLTRVHTIINVIVDSTSVGKSIMCMPCIKAFLSSMAALWLCTGSFFAIWDSLDGSLTN